MVAVRGRDDVEGAVQRVLNKRRVGSIKNFILEGNMFFNSFILNWVNSDYLIDICDGKLHIPQVSAGAQVIDGQHRLEGLKQAVEETPSISEQSIVIVLVQHLSTNDAAKLFLNINTEQKPVPASLVYDLLERSETEITISFELQILLQSFTKIRNPHTISVLSFWVITRRGESGFVHFCQRIEAAYCRWRSI